MEDGKIYCKKCGAWVVPENGECPRCGYQLDKKSFTAYLVLLIIVLILILIRRFL